MDLTKERIRTIIYYCWKRGLPTSEIHKEMNNTLGKDTASLSTCKNWVRKFNADEFDVEDNVRSGRPSMDIKDKIQEILDTEKHATTRSISLQLNISNNTAWRHLLEMGKHYLANVWVPHKLTEANKLNRVRICQELLERHSRANFLMQLVTCDEIWIYWDNEGMGGQRKSWRGAGDTPVTIPLRTMTTRKHLASVFWDAKGLILIDVLPPNQSINAEHYCRQLDLLKAAIIQKRRRLSCLRGMSYIHYLHDNARPHTAGITVQKLHDIGFTILPHPPYSPDLSPSDFYLFSPMKSAIRGKNFDNVADTMVCINEWFANKSPDFFANGMLKLPGRWEKCIKHKGDYFSHLRDNDEELV